MPFAFQPLSPFRKATVSILFAASLSAAATCTSIGTSVQPSSSATWDCGHVPTSSDAVIILTPVRLTGDLIAASIQIGSNSPNNAKLTTDGANAHLVQSTSPIVIAARQLSHLVTDSILDTCPGSAGKEVTFALN